MEIRNIGVLIGSDSDLPQSIAGLEYLAQMEDKGKAECGQATASIHRNTRDVLDMMDEVHEDGMVHVLIVGAGWANHLTGTVDAYLRYTLKNIRVVVVGVSYADCSDGKHTYAAEACVSEVPGTQVVFQDEEGQFTGSDGFLRACKFAVEGELPELTAKEPPPVIHRTIQEALARAYELRDEVK